MRSQRTQNETVRKSSARNESPTPFGADHFETFAQADEKPSCSRTHRGLRSKKVRNTHLVMRSIVFNGGMNTTPTVNPKPGNQLWGIYHTDREYAREHGDPLRTVVEASTKLAAEELAARLGFGESWAHPIKAEEVEHAEWLPTHRPGHRQELARKLSRGVRV
jgi:hypothetical protein